MVVDYSANLWCSLVWFLSQWYRVGVITTLDEDDYCNFVGKALDLYLSESKKEFWMRYRERLPSPKDIDNMLVKIEKQVRSECQIEKQVNSEWEVSLNREASEQ